MALGATVVVSARAKSFQDAYQISGLVVLPVILLMLGQFSGLFFLGAQVAILIGLAFYLIAALLALLGARVMRRQEILARL